ncbi:MAG TPA: hypothetical protein VMY18_05390 [Acidobacteriota bacterium]|nr:hypothetical protein [Acidobacteriota bacterium]
MATREQIQAHFEEEWEGFEFLLADGFENAFIGVVYGKMREPVACYDRKKCISILIARDGMTEEDAEEYFSFNVDDAWMGEKTPMFLDTFEPMV